MLFRSGLIEVISLDESGHGKAISDLPMGSYYVQEISTNSAYIVSDAKYPVTFEYAGQDTETVRITANEGEAITALFSLYRFSGQSHQ